MRGFLNEIKNTAINRATNRLNSALGSLNPLGGNGLPRRSGGVVQTNQFARLSQNPFEGKSVIYPEDLGSIEQGHYIQFFINEQSHANVDFGAGGKKSFPTKTRKVQTGTKTVSVGPPSEGRTEEVPVFREETYTDYSSPNPNRQTKFDTNYKNTEKTTLSVDRPPTKRLATSIAMYMPATVELSQTSKYGEHEIGTAALAAMEAYKGFQNNLSMEEMFDNVIKPIEEGAGQMAKKALDLIAPGAKAALELRSGKVFNNRMEMLFEGVDRRTFSYTFRMMPKSEAEANAVDEIVRMFRFYMAPSFDGDISTSRTMIPPATFDIEYRLVNGNKQNAYLNRISTCVLEKCDVKFGGERVGFFRPNDAGAPPVETEISLSFRELEILTRERLGAGY